MSVPSHGYVVVRADMRGAGDSDGVYYDEYLAQEQEDCCNLIGQSQHYWNIMSDFVFSRLDHQAGLVHWQGL